MQNLVLFKPTTDFVILEILYLLSNVMSLLFVEKRFLANKNNDSSKEKFVCSGWFESDTKKTTGTNHSSYLFCVQELHELVGLHHEVQLLSMQLHVKQLAGEKLLPLLEKIDPSDRLG